VIALEEIRAQAIDIEPGGEASPFAVESIRRRTPVLSRYLNSQDWKLISLALRQRAQFSSEVENFRLMQQIQRRLEQAISQLRNERGVYVNEQQFVAEMKKIVEEEGLGPIDPRDIGTLKDIGSEARLRLIWRFQTEQANEYARWRMANDPDVLNAFPAQEFKRVAVRRVPRLNWPERFTAAGGRIIHGRMIDLVNSTTWENLSVFGQPWPPFDYNSGMGLVSLSRRETESLGLLQPGEKVTPRYVDFNAQLEASVRDLSERYQNALKTLFGDQIVIEDGAAKWQGNIIADLYDRVLKNPGLQQELSLGTATASTVQKAREAGVEDLTGYRMVIRTDEMRKIYKKRGIEEADPTQAVITQNDWEALPFVWRDPDSVQIRRPRNFILTKRIDGTLYVAEWIRNRENKTVMLRTFWKKKAGPLTR